MQATSQGDAGMSIGKIALASAIGTTIEWYDFFLYGVVTPIVLNKLFFPNFDPVVGTLLAYTTFFVGFLSRPIGGIIFGHYGDRIGRKTVLVLTLLIMGLATFLIGLLPTYASAGIWAPIMLLGMGARYIEGVTFNIFGVFIIAYVTGALQLPRQTALAGVMISSAIMLVMLPIYGNLSDH